LALAVVAAVKNKSLRFLVVLLPIVAIYYFVDDLRAGRLLPPVPFFIVFVLSVIFLLYIYGSVMFYKYAYQRKFIRLAGIFILCFICFSTINFFTPRYLLCAITHMFVLTAIFIDMQAEVDFLEKNVDRNKVISCISPLGRIHLLNPATGFLHTDKPFDAHWDFNENMDYAIFDNIEINNQYELVKNNSKFHLIYRAQKGNVWTEIYERK
jgi:hypothetical protein